MPQDVNELAHSALERRYATRQLQVLSRLILERLKDGFRKDFRIFIKLYIDVRS